MSLVEIPQSRLWIPPKQRSDVPHRRRSFERRFARSRTKLWQPGAPDVWAGFSLNQPAVNVTSGGGSTNIAYGQNVGAGDLLVLCLIGKWNPNGALNITDTQSNSWSQAVNGNNGGTPATSASIAWAVAKASGACTITTNPAGSTVLDLVAYDFAGFNGSAAVDKTAGPGTGGNPTDSVGPVITSFANEVAVAAFYFNGNATSGNWTYLVTSLVNLAEYIILTANGNQTATAVTGDVGDIMALATFYSPAQLVGPNSTNDPLFFGCNF
jgi:hypothetical protein